VANYIEKAELSRAVRESQAAGRMTDELAAMISMIAARYAAKYARPDELDDLVQDVCVSLVVGLPKIDPEKNVFNYVTTTVANSLRHHYRERQNFHRLRAGAWDRASRQ
jgi:RNA polymerase sigma factor (sigma-70 family)